MGLLEKTVTPHPPKKTSHNQMVQTIKRPTVAQDGERVLQQLWDESCSSGAKPGHSGPQLAYQ